jgi:hypothetical protein
VFFSILAAVCLLRQLRREGELWIARVAPVLIDQSLAIWEPHDEIDVAILTDSLFGPYGTPTFTAGFSLHPYGLLGQLQVSQPLQNPLCCENGLL